MIIGKYCKIVKVREFMINKSEKGFDDLNIVVDFLKEVR